MGKPKKKSVEERPLTKIKNGSIIALFDKTPEPELPSDIHCPHFWECKYANGCKFDCQWCYLNGTFRYNDWGKAPRLKDERMIKSHIEEALERIRPAQLFNAGEVSDGMVFPITLKKTVIPPFQDERLNKEGHKLLILTKSDDTRLMSYANAKKEVIFAWSINAEYVSHNYELKAPHPWNRLMASRKAEEYGYETRLRIDPMVPVRRWDLAYGKLIDKVMEINPWASVITLGSLRGLSSTITAAKKLRKDTSWTDYLTDKTNWGLRVPKDTRVEMYRFAINRLREAGYSGHIAICKESIEVWKGLGLDQKKTKCNCQL